jgi:hypothetical protein
MDRSSGQSIGRTDLLVDASRVGEGDYRIGDEMRGARDGHPLFGHWVRIGGSRSMPGSMGIGDWEMK